MTEAEQTHSKALHTKMGRSAETKGHRFCPASSVGVSDNTWLEGLLEPSSPLHDRFPVCHTD